MKTLVEDSLRMRPDRVIVGEVRTEEETASFIETILSGQARGSYATFHAQSSEEAVKRMMNLGISKYDVSSIDLILVQRRIMKYDPEKRKYWEERKGIEVSEVGEEGNINKIFTLNRKTNTMEGDPTKSMKFEEIADSFGFTKKELIDELEERKKFLSSLKSEKFNDVVFQVQNKWFSNIDVKSLLNESSNVETTR